MKYGLARPRTETVTEIDDTTIQSESSFSEETKLIIHRGHVFTELLEAFSKHDLQNSKLRLEMILPNEESEMAEDAGGVFRDAISEFWDEFYENCTTGTSFKVPYVRHDFGEKQWKAVADIILRGYKEESYFPVKLAPAFIKNVLDTEVTEEVLVNNFLQYISESEADVLRTAMGNYSDADNGELPEMFSNYDSKWFPTEKNIKQLTIDLAHKELIQKPAFIAKCFRNRFASLLSSVDIDSIYKCLVPTVKNILDKISISEEMSSQDTTEVQCVFSYLKKYIKESDTKTRENFLRFCTGSNLVTRHVKIMFNELSGFRRTPIAHTCTGVLELSKTYDNYLDFRKELNEVLQSKIWIMDLI